MPDQPTIWDILGYEQDAQYGLWDEEGNEYFPNQLGGRHRDESGETGTIYEDLPEGVTEGRRGGQGDMLSYLSDLLSKSKGQDFALHAFSGTGSSKDFTIEEFLTGTGGDMSWLDMDEEELSAYMENFDFGMEGGGSRRGGRGGRGGAGGTTDWQFDPDSLKYLQQLQEGFKAAPTSESFGLDRKIGDIETSGKRELKSAREGYIPGEILSRYGALQGKAGAQQKGEQLEQAYTEDIYGVQRGMGRDVRSTYEDFEDEWFGGVESWIGGLG